MHQKIDGEDVKCWRVAWRIAHLHVKLRGCMGRAIVSPPFSVCGLDDVRLMMCPVPGQEGMRNRKAKEEYNKKVQESRLDGCLKLKGPSCPPPHELTYFLTVGKGDKREEKGPFKHNFSDSTVTSSTDFGSGWIRQVADDQSLTVSVTIKPYDGAPTTVPSTGTILTLSEIAPNDSPVRQISNGTPDSADTAVMDIGPTITSPCSHWQ